MILNLKKLIKYFEAPSFKMESIKKVLCMIEPGAWIGSADLKDAFPQHPFTPIIKRF